MTQPSPLLPARAPRRFWLPFILGLLLGIGIMLAYGRIMQSLMGGFGGPGGPGGGGDFALPVLAAPVKLAAQPPLLDIVGTLVADQAITLAAEMDGRIRDIPGTEGQPVKAGDVILRLDADVQKAALAEAEANAKLSRLNAERAENLVSRDAMSARARDEARAQKERDDALVALRRAELAKTELRAPFDGVLGVRQANIGAFVRAGDALITLTALDPLKVELRVPERYLSMLKSGQPVRLSTDSVAGKVFDATIAAIDPQVDPVARNILLRAVVPNPSGALRPGLFARAQIDTGADAKALLIPEEAVVLDAEGAFVYRVAEDVAKVARVSLGLRRAGFVEVTAGLKAGDIVVTDGQIKLQPDMKVIILNPTEAGLPAPAKPDAPAAAPAAAPKG